MSSSYLAPGELLSPLIELQKAGTFLFVFNQWILPNCFPNASAFPSLWLSFAKLGSLPALLPWHHLLGSSQSLSWVLYCFHNAACVFWVPQHLPEQLRPVWPWLLNRPENKTHNSPCCGLLWDNGAGGKDSSFSCSLAAPSSHASWGQSGLNDPCGSPSSWGYLMATPANG